MTTRLTRRSVLLMLAGGVGGGVWLVAGVPAGCGPGRHSVVLDVLEIFADRETLLIVGEAVLRAEPSLADDELLSQAILSHPRWDSGGDPGHLFAEQVAEDFGAGRVMEVGGWVLAQSEAKLCALVLLLAGRPSGLPR